MGGWGDNARELMINGQQRMPRDCGGSGRLIKITIHCFPWCVEFFRIHISISSLWMTEMLSLNDGGKMLIC